MAPVRNQEIVQFFYTAVGNDEYRCICGITRKQVRNSGYQNLLTHVTAKHPDWETQIRANNTVISGMLISAKVSGSTGAGYADIAIAAKKKKSEMNLSWILPTSIVAERLFSRAKFVFSDYRKKTLPINLESQIFLFVNKSFWDIKTVKEIVK